jgi:TatA/E family protein of Tat protein translocase
MYLLILDSLGSTELLVILGAALIFFGPRKLPQLSRQLGKSLSEFRRASGRFQTHLGTRGQPGQPRQRRRARRDQFHSRQGHRKRFALPGEAAALDSAGVSATAETIAPSITPIDPALVQPRESASATEPEVSPTASAKHEWL